MARPSWVRCLCAAARRGSGSPAWRSHSRSRRITLGTCASLPSEGNGFARPTLVQALGFLDGPTALGTDGHDQGKAALTLNPSLDTHCNRTISARNGESDSRSSAPRKPSVKQSATAAPKPPVGLLGRDELSAN